MVVLGDLNVDLTDPAAQSGGGGGEDCQMATAALVDSLGLSSVVHRFRQRRRWLGRLHTWFKKYQDGNSTQSMCDYILTDRPGRFCNCQLRVPRVGTDHHAVVGTYLVASVAKHKRYTRRRQQIPFCPLQEEDRNQADHLLEQLKAAIPGRDAHDGRVNSWISQESPSSTDP